jgi:hypothetical protein
VNAPPAYWRMACADAWWTFNVMTIPCVVAYALGSQPPMGEGGWTGWDSALLFIAFASSCLCWGAVGATIAWFWKRPSQT